MERHFKVGDSLQENSGTNKGKIITIKSFYGSEDYEATDGSCWTDGYLLENFIKLTKNNNKLMGKLTQIYKSITRTEPDKTFIKAGVLGEDLELTPEGNDLFISYLFALNKDAFKSAVVDVIVSAQGTENK